MAYGLKVLADLLYCANFSRNIMNSPIPVKFVLITMYELAPDDQPGEFQFFCESHGLEKVYPLPAGAFDIWANDKGLIGLVVGVGAAKASASTIALGLDPRFDLTRAYLMIAGICGVNPRYCSIGSVVWGDYCVDGDLAHEFDPREMPQDWDTGIIPLGTFAPYAPSQRGEEFLFLQDELYCLNSDLCDWAYQLTKSIDLGDLDTPKMAAYRKRYSGTPEAQKPPFILKGDNLGVTRYWHGRIPNEWAEKWVDYWTEGKGRFVTSTMEDNGTLRALKNLSNAEKIDWDRVLLLRSGSNYTMQAADGQTVLESFRGEGGGGETMFPGYISSLRALERVGSTVINEILDNWESFADTSPG